LAESIINLMVSVWLVNLIGIPGVFIGTVISGILTYFWREPYLLNKHVLQGIAGKYWVVQLAWIGLTVLLCGILLPMVERISFGIPGFIIQMGIAIFAPNLVIMAVFCRSREWLYWREVVYAAIRRMKDRA